MNGVAKHNGLIFRGGGTSRSGRILQALDPDAVPVDDRGIAALLAQVWRYAGGVIYYDAHNQPDGNWQDLLSVDPAIAMAVIATQAADRDNISGGSVKAASSELENEFDALLQEVWEMTRWQKMASSHNQFKQYLQQLLQSHLIPELTELFAMVGDMFSEDQLSSLAKVRTWMRSMDGGALEEKDQQDARTPNAEENPEVFKQRINSLASSMKSLRAFIKAEALKRMQVSLDDTGTHKAHTGLLLSFLSLFQDLQQQINNISKRHLHYYFRELLGFDYPQPVPDRVFAVFTLAAHIKSHTITKGNGFKAGKDQLGKELVYRLEDNLTVSRAQITALKNISIKQSNDNKLTVCGGDLQLKNEPNSNPQLSEVEGQPIGCSIADIGFGISTPLLRLGQGNRTITFVLDLKFSSQDQLETFRNFYTQTENLKRNVEKDTWISLQNVFRLHFTGETKWETLASPETLSVSLYTKAVALRGIVEKGGALARIKITAVLSAGQSAVIDYNPAIHGMNCQSPWPVLRFLLDQQKHLGLYGLLQGVTVLHCQVSAHVTGMTDVIIENELGPQVPAKPFMPFGPTPREGSGFLIGSQEIFQKKLDELKITWQWPDAPGNFREYFKSYDKYSDIQIQVRVLRDQQWEEIARGVFDLEGRSSTAIYFPEVRLAESGEKLSFTPDQDDFSCFDYKLSQGFIKIELCNRDATFGHREYPELLKLSMMPEHWYEKQYDSLKEVFFGRDGAGPLEMPYTPLFEAMKIDYRSSQKIDFREDTAHNRSCFSMLRINPFGFDKIKIQEKDPCLLPDYSENSYLYIGIKEVVLPQELALLFQMDEADALHEDQEGGVVKWAFLVGNKWEDFGPSDIISDSTVDLAQSGIVRLKLRGNSGQESTRMPAGVYWIRLALCQGGDILSRIKAIHAQAACLVFSDQGNDPRHLSKNLPAGTISGPLQNITEISSVIQPEESFGGQGPAAGEQFCLEVSERLRHKDRAVTAWDYERLVLQNFPEIKEVKCLSHTDKDLQPCPGKVTIVVIPSTPENDCAIATPGISKVLRDRIQSFLQARSAEVLTIAVISPRYEEVQIDGEIRFNDGCDCKSGRRELYALITELLTPWQNGREELRFGQGLVKKDIVDAIMSQPFVEDVVNLSVLHRGERHLLVSDEQVTPDSYQELTGSTPASIIMSAASHKLNCLVDA